MRFLLNHVKRARVWAPVVAFATFACVSPPLESPKPTIMQQTPIRVAQNVKNKVDVLFMIDNSNSMSAMSAELVMRFDQFFKVFQDLATAGTYADLQIGVVTSDYGAGATGAPGCQPSPGGQSGKLQGLGVNAPNTCKAPQGANFIKYAFNATNDGPNNLPQGQDLVSTFTCMGSVGSSGCGFEHQLESVYAALHNNLAENAGFVRDDALLTVVFLTNEDDSSAPPDSPMFDKNQTAQFGYEDSYRSTRFGIVCGPDPGELPPYGDSMGPLANCKAAPNLNGSGPGMEYDISRYIQFFSKPAVAGGVKTNPGDVILVAIDAPSDPVQIILSNPGTAGGTPYATCGQLNESSNPPCVPVLQHSCQNTAQPVFFGDPAVRLNTVVNSAANHAISSICDADYTGALQNLAKLIVSNIGGGCIPSPLANVDTSQPSSTWMPDCVVADVTQNMDGTTTQTPIPQCDNNNAMGASVYPCWSLDQKDTCSGGSPQSVGITINRNGQPAPPNTDASVACATISQ